MQADIAQAADPACTQQVRAAAGLPTPTGPAVITTVQDIDIAIQAHALTVGVHMVHAPVIPATAVQIVKPHLPVLAARVKLQQTADIAAITGIYL